MQSTILFSLRHGMSTERQNAFLDKVRNWSGVKAAERLDPKSKDLDALRACFLYTDSNVRVEVLAARLKRNENVETASVQPYRYAAAI
jgi:hypothetical protein